MNAEILNLIGAENKETRASFPKFGPGDTINVHYKIKEGAKERIQQFQGTVLQIKNSGTAGETFTVRKVSGGIAVERIFPFLTPNIEKVELLRRGKVRRAKLYYLRDRKGKSARIKEKI
jgi:large subunit ribosomal protein L19